MGFSVFFCISDLTATYGLNRPGERVIDGIKCILSHSTADPNHALDVCGETTFFLKEIWVVYCLVGYAVFFGCIPLLIFGCKALRAKIYAYWMYCAYGTPLPSKNRTSSRQGASVGSVGSSSSSSSRDDQMREMSTELPDTINPIISTGHDN